MEATGICQKLPETARRISKKMLETDGKRQKKSIINP
jgi:hypothetical protein